VVVTIYYKKTKWRLYGAAAFFYFQDQCREASPAPGIESAPCNPYLLCAPAYLADSIERVQKRALNIILNGRSYRFVSDFRKDPRVCNVQGRHKIMISDMIIYYDLDMISYMISYYDLDMI
jgi:hypothetical protein